MPWTDIQTTLLWLSHQNLSSATTAFIGQFIWSASSFLSKWSWKKPEGYFYKLSIDLSTTSTQPEFWPTKLGKLWEAINAKQKKPQFGNNVTQIFENSGEFVGNKATNHGMYFFVIWKFAEMLNLVTTSVNCVKLLCALEQAGPGDSTIISSINYYYYEHDWMFC